MNSKLRHVVEAVYDRPWFITPQILGRIDQIVQLHVAGARLDRTEIQERLDIAAAANGPRRGARTTGSVAVIPIYGAIFPRANLMTDFSGGATVESIRASFREVLADDSVGSILFDVDSPGGYTDGIEELATEIRESRGQKPIVAIANYTMASAAYYLASQADEVVASPSSMVGWIGTVMVHQEYSKMDAEAGITTTIIRDPEGKYGGNEYEPLSAEARAEMQQAVDDHSRQFHNAVAKGRAVSVSTVRAEFGKGGGMSAARAKTAGLVDRVEAFDATLRRLATGNGGVSRGTGATGAWTFAAAEPATPNQTVNLEPEAALEEPIQGGDDAPVDDPGADAPGETGTPPQDETMDPAELRARQRRAARREGVA